MTSAGLSADDRVKRIAVLGSTGSIGRQTLDVVRRHADRFEVVAVAGLAEAEELAAQAREFSCAWVGVGDARAYGRLASLAGGSCRVVAGPEGMGELASLPGVDVVVMAISGAAALLPMMAAVKAGKRIALANKECLVAAGDLVMSEVAARGAQVIPVDSEHSAIFQSLRDEGAFLARIWLTASGGPFRKLNKEELGQVTPQMALAHPNWQMGPKITVDSATLFNKGLEVIEAHHLFGVSYDDIEVVIHPESVIHSMVEFVDGSVIAQMGVPDMRIPIQYALTYPVRHASPARRLDFFSLACMSFARADTERFPGLALAVEAGRTGGTMPAVMNAANEVAVGAFLAGDIRFTDIPDVVSRVMGSHRPLSAADLGTILEADGWARKRAAELVRER